MILAIDPGPVESAWVLYQNDQGAGARYHAVVAFAKQPNEEVLRRVRNSAGTDRLVIEMIQSFGMPVGAEVFETCVWIGRFMQAYGGAKCDRLTRATIKSNLCGSAKAKDANIRQALIDRFGGPQCIRKGGPLYKVSGDVWSALAVGVTWADRQRSGLVQGISA